MATSRTMLSDLITLDAAISNSMVWDLVIRGMLVIFIVAILLAAYKMDTVIHLYEYYSYSPSVETWKLWTSVAQPLSKMGLLKASELSSASKKKYLAAARRIFWKLAKTPEDSHLLFQESKDLQLPRIKGEWEECKQFVTTTINNRLLPPLTNIINEYSKVPIKLDLCVDDLEYYFLSSGLIELKPSATFLSNQLLRVLYCDDPLLLTVPSRIIRGSCRRPRAGLPHGQTCNCDLEVGIYPYLLDRPPNHVVKITDATDVTTNISSGSSGESLVKIQLEKNIEFIQSLSTTLGGANFRLGQQDSNEWGFPVKVKSTLRWTKEFQQESRLAVIAFTSIRAAMFRRVNGTPKFQSNFEFVNIQNLFNK